MTPEIMTAKMMAYDSSYSSYSNIYMLPTPYERTYELCNEHTVCLFSGNVIKFNTYELKKPFIVSNQDDEFRVKLENMRIENSVVYEQDDEDGFDDTDDITDDEFDDDDAASLLTDDNYISEDV